MNAFENFYIRLRDARAAYKAADDAGNESERRAASLACKAVWKEVEELGFFACRLFTEYDLSRNCGNEILDITTGIWDRDVAETVAVMRENGIERFAFSTCVSRAVETAWLFQKNGCILEGLIEINGHRGEHGCNQRRKAHGLLFRVGD